MWTTINIVLLVIGLIWACSGWCLDKDHAEAWAAFIFFVAGIVLILISVASTLIKLLVQ